MTDVQNQTGHGRYQLLAHRAKTILPSGSPVLNVLGMQAEVAAGQKEI